MKSFLYCLSILTLTLPSPVAFGQSYVYDQADRLEKILYASGRGVTYTYDNRDNLLSVTAMDIPPAADKPGLRVTSTTTAELTWEHSGAGASFIIQGRQVGTDEWFPSGTAAIGDRSAQVGITEGTDLEFRIVVLGAAPGEQSAPSEAVRLASGAPLIVTTLADEDDHALGTGLGDSLREVIEASPRNGTIQFASFLSGGTIFLDGMQINLERSVSIDASTLSEVITIDAANRSPVMVIASADTVFLRNLHLTRGIADEGGAIRNDGAELTLRRCTLDACRSDEGGAVYNTGGGTVITTDGTVISGNAAHSGGGIYCASGSGLEIASTTFAYNYSSLDGGAIHHAGQPASIERSSFVQNNAFARGGAVFNDNTVVVIENTTLSGNASGNNSGGAVANEGTGDVTLRHCTVTDNSGIGVVNVAPATLAVENTILANNVNVLNAALDLEGDYTASGANLVRVHNGSRLGGNAPLTTDPLLGVLRGSRPSQSPLVGSPAIDAAIVTANSPGTDQENQLRPHGSAPELGSIESRLSANVDLDWITCSGGPLVPGFDVGRTNYTVTVDHSVGTAAVRPAAGANGQTIETRIDGGAFTQVASRDASPDYPLDPGENDIEVRVTAQNGITVRTYTITVVRGAPSAANAELASLTTSPGVPSPPFDGTVTDYDTVVANPSAGITVTAGPVNPAATMEVRVNFGAYMPLASGVASDSLPLDPGANVIDLRVTAADGATTMIYHNLVTRVAADTANANLAALFTSAGALDPVFSRGRVVYRVSVPDEVTDATATAVPVSAGATLHMRINGGTFTPVASGAASPSFPLNAGANSLEVRVTAQDGTTMQSYTLLVTRVVDGLEWVSEPGNQSSVEAAISADCRFVAFASRASNLVADDTNGDEDVFVYDRSSDTIERVSVDNDGNQGNFDSDQPAISADGRFVAFRSEADNLVPNDTNGQTSRSAGRDVFVYDRESNTIERVSVPQASQQATQSNQASQRPSLSGDGRYVAFHSGANNLIAGFVAGANNSVYIYDRQEDTLSGIPVPFSDTGANRDSLNAEISGDGRFVAFEFHVSKNDGNNSYKYNDVYLYNVAGGSVERITGSRIGLDADGTDSEAPDISDDGRFVAFHSNLEDIDFFDTNRARDVFVFDRVERTTRRASVDANGIGAASFRNSINASISGDGRFVAFESSSPDLVPGDDNGTTDVFMKDMLSGEIRRMSVNPAGEEANGSSTEPSISSDGRCVAFQSSASNLDPADTSNSDIYLAFTEEPAAASNADLASLASNLGGFDPAFSSATIGYTVQVTDKAGSALLRPVTVDPKATVEARVNDLPFATVSSGEETFLALAFGDNTIDVKVTAEDGTTTRIYSLEVARVAPRAKFSDNACLAKLVPESGQLMPAFAATTLVYAVEVPNDQATFRVTPTLQDDQATLRVNEVPLASGSPSQTVLLMVGPNPILITVVAENGASTKVYALSVTRRASANANLANLVPSVGLLVPVFDPATTDYQASVEGSTTLMTVTPTVAEAGASVRVNGTPVTSATPSGSIPIHQGTNEIITVVTALDGITTKTYTLTVVTGPDGAFRITSQTLIAGTPTRVRLTWESEPNAVYYLETSPGLVDWTPFGGDHPSGGATTTIDFDLTAPQAEVLFIRVVRR